MLFIPMGTDAPIYHWPRATVAIILLNIVAFFAVPHVETVHTLDDDEAEVVVKVSEFDRYALTLGGGMHPVQWVTHNFLHFGIGHLIGNMIFLWAFGIVVEGKLGPLKFVAAYLAVGTWHGLFTQLLLLRTPEVVHAAGASAVIFGLLALCMIWAPRNELDSLVIIFAGFRLFVFHWQLRYTTVALLYLGEQILGLILGGLTEQSVFSELGHLSGAFWGTMLGIAVLHMKWVDCEGWDLFSLAAKRRKLAEDWKKRGEPLDKAKSPLKKRVKGSSAPRAAEMTPEARSADAVARVDRLIERGDLSGALTAYDAASRALIAWPSGPDLRSMIKAMHARGGEVESIRLMRDHCRDYPVESSRIRLKLAHILVRDRRRPAAALKVLAEMTPGTLTAELETVRVGLSRQATQMLDEGEVELDGDD